MPDRLPEPLDGPMWRTYPLAWGWFCFVVGFVTALAMVLIVNALMGVR